MNGALEALDAAPDLGREADCFAEDLGEAALAPADLPCGFAYAGDVGDAFELTKREVDFCGTGRVAAGDLSGEMAAQELLETEETCLRSR